MLNRSGRLFTIGCSFTEYRWPTWANLLGREFKSHENWGNGGGAGNSYIFNALVECIKRNQVSHNDTVIIMWSSVNREDRYVNNKWLSSGNIHVSNIFGEEFTKKFVDGKGNLIRDLAFISAAKDILEKHNINYYFLSAFELTNDNSHNNPIEGIEEVLELYQNEIKIIKPSVAKILFNNFTDTTRLPRPTFNSQQKLTMSEVQYKIVAGSAWPDYATYLVRQFNNLSEFVINDILKREENLKEDWHPTPMEHLEYLQQIFGADIVTEETVQYAGKITKAIFNQETINFERNLPAKKF